MNKWIGVGRLTRDPEFKEVNQNLTVLTFTLAIDRRGKSGKTDFINIEVFGKLAEALQPYLAKGMMVAVDGELHIDQWESNGIRKFAPKIIASSVQILQWNKKDESIPQDDKPPF